MGKPPVRTPTFIVGTGRCGSTMLSNMLREHPDVLSISEFFAWFAGSDALIAKAFSAELLDGREFWSIVATISPKEAFSYLHDIPCEEQLYPIGNLEARYSSRTGVPALLITTLPHLTADHDRLFDELRDEITAWPVTTIAHHYRHLFDRLAERFGKKFWVERTGASLNFIERVFPMFPEAKFVHVARDGRDAAISMQSHLGLRLYFTMNNIAQYLGVDPLVSDDRTNVDRVPHEWRSFLPEQFDADAFRKFRIPMSICAGFWTQQVMSGLKALSALPTDSLLTMRYEDILTEPKRQLETFAAFLGEEFGDADWIAHCAATVRPPRSTWRDLPEEDAHALTEACRPGFEALAAAGVEYEV